MYPTFRLGPLTLSSYTALLDLGVLIGVVLVYLRAHRRRLDIVKALDAALAAALGGLFIARMAYVAIHWAYYQDHVREALRPWGGGLSGPGALIGGLAAAAIFCAVRRMSLLKTLNALAPSVALLAICAWLACLLNGCAHGIEVYPDQELLWSLSLDLPDLYGIWAPRVAVQLLGAIWSAIALGAVVLAERSERGATLAFPLWLVIHNIGSFGLGFVRADKMLFIAGYRVDQIIALGLAIVGGGMLFVLPSKMKSGEEDDD